MWPPERVAAMLNLLSLVLLLPVGIATKPKSKTRPHILFVVADDFVRAVAHTATLLPPAPRLSLLLHALLLPPRFLI